MLSPCATSSLEPKIAFPLIAFISPAPRYRSRSSRKQLASRLIARGQVSVTTPSGSLRDFSKDLPPSPDVKTRKRAISKTDMIDELQYA